MHHSTPSTVAFFRTRSKTGAQQVAEPAVAVGQEAENLACRFPQTTLRRFFSQLSPSRSPASIAASQRDGEQATIVRNPANEDELLYDPASRRPGTRAGRAVRRAHRSCARCRRVRVCFFRPSHGHRGGHALRRGVALVSPKHGATRESAHRARRRRRRDVNIVWSRRSVGWNCGNESRGRHRRRWWRCHRHRVDAARRAARDRPEYTPAAGIPRSRS